MNGRGGLGADSLSLSLSPVAAMLGTFWKRHSHPLNLILLGTFTVFEAITIGSVVSYFNQVVVLQALVITLFLFLGLTLFTFQVRRFRLGKVPAR
jgi:FtsH-binding integral membrane protein